MTPKEIEEMLQEIRDLKADAERYRWLRNPDPQEHREIDVCDDCMNIIDGKELDEMIDAAMAKEKRDE